MARLTYKIYSHEDADGGIAAAIFTNFLKSTDAARGWDFEVIPVAHGAQKGEWSYRDIHIPCAILDFTLHPFFLNDRFAAKLDMQKQKLPRNTSMPPCYWIDHHPTGSSFPFITADNVADFIKSATVLWDVTATSTPSLFRTHRERLGIPAGLLRAYEHYIDLADIIDGALFATAEEAHNFEHLPVQIQVLFSTTHPAIDREALFRRMVSVIAANPNPDELLDSDPLLPAIVQYEQELFQKQYRAYARRTRRMGRTAYANFFNGDDFAGMCRFAPYALFPDVQYAIHLLPRFQGRSIISCGINPWNKPANPDKHLGNFFARYFNGGGHSFVAGGTVAEDDLKLVNKLIDFLEE